MKDKQKERISTLTIFIILMIGAIIGFLIGIPIGALGQQMILFKGIEMVAPAFDGVNIEIKLNETFLLNGMNQILDSQIEEIKAYSGDSHNINIDATCPGRNTSKTVAECIRDYESTAMTCQGDHC